MRWIIIFLGALVTFAGATTWRLPAYRTCGTLDLSRAMEKPFVTGAGMAYQSDENLIWITSGSVLYKISYWDGEVLSTHELRKTGELGLSTLPQAKDYPEPVQFDVAAMAVNSSVAVTDRRSNKITVYIDDPASGVLSHGSDISCGFVPYSLTYDGAYDVFYATSVDDRNVVWEVERGGRQRILFGADSEAARLLGDKQISSIHYAGNTGTLFILCSSCGLVYESCRRGSGEQARAYKQRPQTIMSKYYTPHSRFCFGAKNYPLSSDDPPRLAFSLYTLQHVSRNMLRLIQGDIDTASSLRNTNARALSDLDSSSQAMAFARQGSPMLLLTSDMQVKALCQEIRPAPPVLPPETATIPGPQTWYSLSSYRFCGAWQYDVYDGSQLKDMSVDPATRTVWAVVDGNLNEYSLRGKLLRSQTSEMLAAAGLPGITSVAWIKRSKLLVGMREGNMLAVIDTAPMEAQDRILQVYLQQEGVAMTDDSGPEPPGPDAEMDFLRRINMIEVESLAELGPGLLTPDSLGALAYDSVHGKVLFTSTSESEAAVYRSDLDGSGVEVLLAKAIQLDGSPAGRLSNLLYSPAAGNSDDYLLWCESCAKLLQVDSAGGVTGQRSFDLLNDAEVAGRASSFSVTPDGSLLMIGANSGEVNFYCSTGSNQASGGAAEDDLVLSIREGSDSLLDPEYFWRVQNIKEAVTPERPAGGNRSADDNYEFFEDVGCRDVSLGSPLAGYDIAECEDSCTAQPTCLGFTYSLARAVCYLKATCNTPYKQPREVTAIKKKKNALVRLIPHQAEYQRLDGLVCATRPLGAALRAARQQRCEKMCSARPECEAYSYDASAGSCLLHKACGNDQLSQSSSGASGFKIAAPALDRGTSGYAVFEGVQCSDRSFRGAAPAAVLSILSTLNQRTCEGFCTLQEHCTAYTYSADTRRCTLRGSCRTYALATGTTTGMRPAGHSAPIPPSWPVSFTLLTSAKCAGPSLAVVLSYTADKCALACTTTVSCKAFSFDNAHRCYLMASCDIIQQPDEAFVSGTNLSIEGPTLAPTPEPTPPQTAPPTTCVDSSDANGDGCLGHLLPLPPSDPALYGGWEYLTDDDEACTPWEGKECGRSANPGLKINDITWYRMFAHRANPLVNRGDGVMEWVPYRTRDEWGKMYWKGSEIIGYFDEPMAIDSPGQEVELKFLWSSTGETQPDFCGSGDARSVDCAACEELFANATGEKLIYHEVRCFSGTGDFRVALTDSTRGGQVDKDGYGYWNDKMMNYRGVQWRFHPQACPKVPRDSPGGYAATAASSWIRSNIPPFNYRNNSKGLVCDFLENSELGDRSFKERMFDPPEEGACLNLPNGEWTPLDKPFVMKLKVLSNTSTKVEFNWRMEFNGWVGQKTEEWDRHLFPTVIDSIVIGYTNPRSFNSMKLRRIY